MPVFGAHMSIAGGYYKALEAAAALGCQSVQLFTKNNNQWRAKAIADEDVELFRAALKRSRLKLPTGHVSYLINLGSPDPTLYDRSAAALVEELQRAERLGLPYLVMHPGTATDGNEDAGLRRIARALNKAHRSCAGYRVKVLLENTAGQGQSLGHRFQHLARILELVKEPERLGVCLDTCHLLAAGYPLASREAYEETFDAFDRIVGVRQVKVFHLNDSKKPLGSRVDRHAHIGQGCLGLEPFRLLVNDRRFARLPMLLETPKENDMDVENLRVLRSLLNA